MDRDKFQDECGVFGIFNMGNEEINTAKMTYYGLYALQHRGQESAGIATVDGEKMKYHKGMGLVAEVFSEKILEELHGNASIGHVRYSTAGGSTVENAQPLIGQFKLGDIATAHNGNLVNADILRELLEDSGHMFQTSTDSEVILKLIARKAKKGILQSVVDTMQAIKGSYGMVFLTDEFLIGVRDPNGIRPLCLGKYKDSYIITSESCGIDAVGGEFIRDIEPGEIVIIDKKEIKSIKIQEKVSKAICAFEYIYFARPDSIMDNINIYEARVRAGKRLFEEKPIEADVVVGVPDSGIPAALGFAEASGIPYALGLVKNRYVGRTFITPDQETRERAVSVKLNVLKSNVEGKRVVLIDDSIVRGTTSKKLIEILKNAGAKEVHLRISSPMVKHSCYFGIDTPYRKDLIASSSDEEEISEFIGADSTGYLSMEGLLWSLNGKKEFCLGCFEGVYPINPSKI